MQPAFHPQATPSPVSSHSPLSSRPLAPQTPQTPVPESTQVSSEGEQEESDIQGVDYLSRVSFAANGTVPPQPPITPSSLPMQGAASLQSRSSSVPMGPAMIQMRRSSYRSPSPQSPIQAKLTVGAPGDKYEQEADQVADRVMKMSAPPETPTIQRQAEDEEPSDLQTKPLISSISPLVQQQQVDEEKTIARSASGEQVQSSSQDGVQAQPDLERRLSSTQGGGQALSSEVRSYMEPRFGVDFSAVRVHTDHTAVQMNQDLNAQAFTHGSNIYFAEGKSPGTNELTAHELTHVVQQTGGGAVKRSPAPINRSISHLATSKASAFVHLHGQPNATPGTVIQRSSSNGVSVSGMKFAPKEIPADGKTTTQATVHYSGRIAGGAKINWSINGPAFGSTIDANGLITPGAAITKGAEKVRIKVKAEDSKFPGANTVGQLTLWDADFLQAKTDYPTFVGQTFKMDPYTLPPDLSKFALVYQPRTHSLDVTLRVSFDFVDDKAGAAKWNNASKRHFEQTFVRVVQNRWSNQYQFVNIREPQQIWKKLNPVRVRVRVLNNAKAATHYAITVHKKSVTAAVGVTDAGGKYFPYKAQFSADDLRPQKAFPNTGAAELAALGGVTPTPILFAAGKSDLQAADQSKLEFMATYLRRIKNPRFKVTITGHHQTAAPGGTAAQQAAAQRQAKKLAQSRANAVFKVLKAGKATFHQIQSRGVGDTGAGATPAWDKAEIASALPPGWQNVQTTLEHEAGHMFGIGDEYVSSGKKVGDKTDHYQLTVDAFGKQYADLQARQVADSASLMNGGNDIRPHHYVTFWDALTQLTKAAAAPKVPFTQKDWKFQGEG